MYLSYTLLILASTEDASISLYIHIHMIIHIGTNILFILGQLALFTHLILISPYASVSRPDLVCSRILAMPIVYWRRCFANYISIFMNNHIGISILFILDRFMQNPGSLIYAQANYYLIIRVNTHLNFPLFSFPSIYRYNPK